MGQVAEHIQPQVKPLTKDAYALMHDGILALNEVEQNGMCIDIDYCETQISHIDRKVNYIESKLLKDPLVKAWKKKWGPKFNLHSGHQLADALFVIEGLEPVKMTKGKTPKPAVDAEALQALNMPFVNNMLHARKLKKARDTYLTNLISETTNGMLHPFFSLHNVRSFRGSSQAPNFQNIPTRDAEIKKIIRRAFKPRPGHIFGGIDFGSMEVRIAACYHKDPNMLKYIIDPTTDMHRDVTMDCFLIDDPLAVHKDARQSSKSGFTFSQLYGDYYKNCAKNLWDTMNSAKLTMADGQKLLKTHLAEQGIKTYQQFENHIKDVEDKFWNVRFPVYTQWKEDWKKQYDKNGYMDLLTGFRCSGLMGKNDVLNYQIQGAAFHCLLWSLIQIQKWLKKYKFKSLIVGQIHDEIVMDIHESEIEIVLAKCREVMTVDVVKHWPWIIVPLEVDASFCSPNDSWYTKGALPMPEYGYLQIEKMVLEQGYTSVYDEIMNQ